MGPTPTYSSWDAHDRQPDRVAPPARVESPVEAAARALREAVLCCNLAHENVNTLRDTLRAAEAMVEAKADAVRAARKALDVAAGDPYRRA